MRHATRPGRPVIVGSGLTGMVVSRPDGFARYRLADGMVVEIWTRRANYVFQFGPTMRHAWRWYVVFAQFAFWVKLGGGRKLTMSETDKVAARAAVDASS